eukprot:CAMPEP_0116941316 /NCGR_PEP_ID=MMETSP0467-20121206/33909_1 /TAXON_ID=283647 /ORGANISM="Mesodinium pulex, Strain SPMC105" /LENGTH=197 /DNA_ID=CAMNT_0004624063 /DNA_START=1621 /DNA_END=2215 /DNA_ORIENTATION=+
MFDVNFLCSIVFRVWEEQLENGQTNLTIEIMHSPGIRQLNVGTSYPDNMDDHGDYKDLEKLVEINVNEFLQMTDFDENHYIIKDNENAREFVKMCTSLNINKKTQKIHKDKEVRNTYEKYTEQNVKMLKKILQTDEKMSPEKDKKRNRSSSLAKKKGNTSTQGMKTTRSRKTMATFQMAIMTKSKTWKKSNVDWNND